MGGNVSAEQRVLDVVLSFAEDETLPDLLRHVVESACDLIGASYGALAVIDGHRALHEFVADDGQVSVTSGDPRSIGVADFLGASVQVHGETFGNLFLSGKAEFTGEDQDVLAALVTAAGAAIGHLSRYEQTRKREAWLRAATEVTTRLLTGSSERDALYVVVKSARVTAEADFAALVLPDHNGDLVIEVTDGGRYDAEGMRLPKEGTVSYRVYRSGQAECHDEGTVPTVPGACAVVPLSIADQVRGVLIVSRKQGEPGFGDDFEALQAFAKQAALVLEFARAQGDTERIAVLEERDRIARDLHDLVIQRLFGLGLGLQGLTNVATTPPIVDRISGFVEEVDHTIREIRRTIFSLQEPLSNTTSLRGQLLRAVHDSAQLLGFEPDVALEGPLDTVVPDQVRPDLLATLREALTNVVRHARARHVAVAIGVSREVTRLELTVTDDGRGLPLAEDSHSVPHHAGGLANMAARARRHRGDCSVDSIPGAGVSITWFVPLVLQEARWR